MLKADVLRNKQDFSDIYKKGKSVGDKYVVVFYRKNQQGFNRTAFLASKKVGKSVQRNLARRWMKEAYRFLKPCVSGQSFDIIFIARNTITSADYHKVVLSMERALKKCRLLSVIKPKDED